jgi:hypothetical protein
MLAYRHSGFSVDTSVCIAAHDSAGLRRLLGYCERPPFACERLRKAGRELVYRCAKQHSEPGSHPHNKRGAKVDEITLTPLELIDRIAALVATTANASSPLLWRSGTELTFEACRNGVGTRCSGATGAGVCWASQHGCRRGAHVR